LLGKEQSGPAPLELRDDPSDEMDLLIIGESAAIVALITECCDEGVVELEFRF
jgi:hypothetical protein